VGNLLRRLREIVAWVVRGKVSWTLVCVGLAISLGVGGCRAKPALTPQEMEGKHLYQMRCAHCHEDNDQALRKIPPDLHSIFERQTLLNGAPSSDAVVRQIVLAGRGTMPAFAGRFTDEQMAALLAYLHTGLL